MTTTNISMNFKDTHDHLALSLEIISKILDRPISFSALRAGLPLVDHRLTPHLFIRAAHRAHISAKIVSKKLHDIPKLLLPCVLLLKDNKACILESVVDEEKVAVIWPETGDGTDQVTYKDLEPLYTGQVIFTRPRYRYDSRSINLAVEHPQSWFWGTLSQFWSIYYQVIIASILINLFGVASSFFAMNVYDRVIPNSAFETLWVLSAGVILLYTFEFLMRTLRGHFLDTVGKNLDILFSSRIYEHILGIRLEARAKSSGTLAHELREFGSLREFFSSLTLMSLVDLPFFFVFLVFLYFINPSIAYLVTCYIPLAIGIGYTLHKRLAVLANRHHREASQRHSLLSESIYGLETIKSHGAEGKMQRQWDIFVDQAAYTEGRVKFTSTLVIHLSLFLQNLLSVMVIIFGVYEISQHALTTGGLIACTILSSRAQGLISQAIGVLTRFNMMMATYKSFDRIFKKPLERPSQTVFLHRPTLKGHIEFRDVSFSYPGSKIDSLHHLSFKITPGEKVGIVGRVGSGKSTIEKLILGLYQPTGGSILIDGTDNRQIDPADLRSNIGYVPQDIYLFYGSIRDNITLKATPIDDEGWLQAAQLAGVHEIANSHPLGYELNVGEGGLNLSGGQRQSIAIARALIGMPPLFLLDEPTSAMDHTSESIFKENMQATLKDRTVIIATHRLSLLSLVDRLIVIDQGRVVLDGPTHEVVERLNNGGAAA
jgi:ATP-binding cassette subfamily C protein LapB